jgi:hypothetical protein
VKRVVVALILAMCAVAGVLTYLNDKATNGGLPLVHAAMPRQGFVCTPGITPRIGPVRSREIV